MTIMERIKALCEQRGWSLYELSKRSDISETTIYTWNSGKRTPSNKILKKVCNALGINLFQFYSEVGNNLSEEQKKFIESFVLLNSEEREAVLRNWITKGMLTVGLFRPIVEFKPLVLMVKG